MNSTALLLATSACILISNVLYYSQSVGKLAGGWWPLEWVSVEKAHCTCTCIYSVAFNIQDVHVPITVYMYTFDGFCYMYVCMLLIYVNVHVRTYAYVFFLLCSVLCTRTYICMDVYDTCTYIPLLQG